jgi:hypothetical protein
MNIRDVMTKPVAFCGPEANLAHAPLFTRVTLMRKNACGFLPVAGKGASA